MTHITRLATARKLPLLALAFILAFVALAMPLRVERASAMSTSFLMPGMPKQQADLYIVRTGSHIESSAVLSLPVEVLDVTIGNQGNGAAGHFAVRWGGNEYQFAGLAAGATIQLHQRVGSCTLRLVVDYYGSVAERSETNNTTYPLAYYNLNYPC